MQSFHSEKDVCIVIPIYNEKPGEKEILAIQSVYRRLVGFDLYFITPKGMNPEWYQREYPQFFVRKYSEWSNSIQSYSDLLLSRKFYEEYRQYKYMLICQTDALVLGNREDLLAFCNMGYDYFGAPWEPFLSIGGREIPKYRLKKWQKNSLIYRAAKVRKCEVGNGGFSLRKIDSMMNLLKHHSFPRRVWNYNEDLFFSYYHQKDKPYEINIAPADIAIQFAKETGIKEAYENGKLPFGVHAWEKDWSDGIEIFRSVINEDGIK